MSSEAKKQDSGNYNQELVQVLKEHELLRPEEEEQMISYLWATY